MNVEKRLKEIGEQSYGTKTVTLTVEYSWICEGAEAFQNNKPTYRLTANLWAALEHGQSLSIRAYSIEDALDQAEHKLHQYKKDKELYELRRKMDEIHQLSGCPA